MDSSSRFSVVIYSLRPPACCMHPHCLLLSRRMYPAVCVIARLHACVLLLGTYSPSHNFPLPPILSLHFITVTSIISGFIVCCMLPEGMSFVWYTGMNDTGISAEHEFEH